MRTVIYIVLLGLLFFAPVEPANLTDLLPAEAVAVYVIGEKVFVETDTGEKGEGVDAIRAIMNLKNKTPGIVYLDTAEYLMFSEEALGFAEQLRGVLKPSVKVCVCDAGGRVAEQMHHLSVHGNLPALRIWRIPEKKTKNIKKSEINP